MEKQLIYIATTIDAPLEQVWAYYTRPEHIIHWNHAIPEWHCPTAENDLREGGKFSYRMEAKDGSAGFDFEGHYNRIVPLQHIDYTMEDGRKAAFHFKQEGGATRVAGNFEAESQHSAEMQKSGWQAILNNFKSYAEQQ